MSLWQGIKKFIDALTVIITLLNFFFKIEVITDLIRDTWLETLINHKYSNYVVIGILLSCLVMWIISAAIGKNKNITLWEKNHEFFHELRNGSFEARDVTKDSQTAYNRLIKQTSEKFCRIMSEYFHLKYNKRFNICIKTIDVTSSRTSSSINEIKVYTLARGGKDKIQRENLETTKEVFVRDDTSYIKILSNENTGRKSDYTCTNLIVHCLLKKASRDPYLPPFKTFYKKYLSTIVVPIRINSAILPDDSKYISNNDQRYQVFGFLCLDYKFPIRRNLSKCLCQDLKAFADSLYIVYDEVIKANIKYDKEISAIAYAVQRN